MTSDDDNDKDGYNDKYNVDDKDDVDLLAGDRKGEISLPILQPHGGNLSDPHLQMCKCAMRKRFSF